MAVASLGRKRRGGRLGQRIGFGVLVFVCIAPTLFVFFWMLSLSLKSQVDNLASPPIFVPRQLVLDHYAAVLRPQFFGYIANSVLIAAGTTLIGLALGAPAAFGIVRWRYHRLAGLILVARIIPAISFLVPWFILFRQLRLIDTYAALILAHLVVNLPIIIWMLIGFFEDVPSEVQDSALVDGCSVYGVFWHVALPLVRPGLAATTILSVIFSWNNFLFSVILAGRSTRPLPVAVFGLLTFEEVNWGPLAAAAVVITVPVLLLTLLVQRHIVAGFSSGAVKG